MRATITASVIVAIVLAVLTWRLVARRSDAPVQMIDPNELLFSLPTLCDAIPATSSAPVPAEAHVIREDDWRQMEFVAAADRDAIAAELARLHEFKLKHRKGIGWDEVYVRKGRNDALAPLGISWPRVKEILPGTERPLAIDTLGKPALIPGGFALEAAHGIVLYGQQSGGKLVSLSLEVVAEKPDFDAARPLLQSLCTRLGLDLVNWYGEEILARAQAA